MVRTVFQREPRRTLYTALYLQNTAADLVYRLPISSGVCVLLAAPEHKNAYNRAAWGVYSHYNNALYRQRAAPLLIVNEQRPYERYGKPSVFNKTTKGKSFPSRHTASAFIIAMAFMYESTPLGIAAMVISLLIEISRILSGAHYIHDVVAGMAFSVIAGYVFFFLI